MHHQDTLVTALARALARDSSARSLQRAIAALRAEHGVSQRRAYAMLVRANAGVPGPQVAAPLPVQRLPSQTTPLAS